MDTLIPIAYIILPALKQTAEGATMAPITIQSVLENHH